MADSLTSQDVAAIAHLARLELDASELEALRGELTAILEHMAILQAVDTDGVEPMTHAVPMQLRLRADRVEESLPVEVALGGAPARAGDHFEVPNIIATSAKTSAGER